MSFVYSSNSPEFLNYVAHTKTRNDIINDPKLCVLLEDPHIKDNMELALLYREAQYGDYEAKKEFIGFLLANGPELDTDTIIYYREKILHNKTYTDIYINDFKSNLSIIDTLRIEKYGKDTTDTNDLLNCLSNPCDYLGPFSSSIGVMGDDKNFNTISNVVARLSGKNEEGKDTSSRVWGSIPQHMIGKLIPDLEKAYRTMLGNMSASYDEFVKNVNDSFGKDLKTVGDDKAENRAKDVAAAVKLNVVSNLGDCARIWESMRRLRVYDPSKNTKKPFEPISKKTVDGVPAPNYKPVTDNSLKPEPMKIKSAASGTKSKEPEIPKWEDTIEKKDINSLDNRYKQTYSIYKYYLNEKKDEILADTSMTMVDMDIEAMQEFIDEMDTYLSGESFTNELPSIPTMMNGSKLQLYQSGWTRGYNGILKD